MNTGYEIIYLIKKNIKKPKYNRRNMYSSENT